MFYKNFFSKGTSKEKIKEELEKDGFKPIVFHDKAGFVYEKHQHPETKVLVCLEGSMKVNVNGKDCDFEVGDKLIIPGNTPHSALVGEKGCLFYWSEKLDC
jgi:quercetin dioxygenase-like cupin family protein